MSEEVTLVILGPCTYYMANFCPVLGVYEDIYPGVDILRKPRKLFPKATNKLFPNSDGWYFITLNGLMQLCTIFVFVR